jgi:uncharacterized protein (TIGR02186 family)
MIRNPKGLVSLGVTWLTLAAGLSTLAEAGVIRLTADPDRIQVGSFYHGAKVRVTADIPVCDDVVVKMEGKDEEVTLNRRARVLGIWLNVAQVTVRNAPQAYVLAASEELANICSRDEQEELGLGFDALGKRMTFTSDKPLSGFEFDEFLKLKEHSGTYAVSTDIDLRPANGHRQELSAILPIPSAMSCGKYTVRLYCFEHGSLIEDAVAQISIEKVGLPRLMTALALEHPAAHGILAVFAALAAGITMGAIFNSRTRRRRRP